MDNQFSSMLCNTSQGFLLSASFSALNYVCRHSVQKNLVGLKKLISSVSGFLLSKLKWFNMEIISCGGIVFLEFSGKL